MQENPVVKEASTSPGKPSGWQSIEPPLSIKADDNGGEQRPGNGSENTRKILVQVQSHIKMDVCVHYDGPRPSSDTVAPSEGTNSTRGLMKQKKKSRSRDSKENVIVKVSKKVGIPGTIFTLLTGVLGAGIITLPYVFYVNGIILGPLLLTLSALLTHYTSHLLVKVSSQLGKTSFDELAKAAYGVNFARVVNFAIVIEHLGVLVAYIVLLKSLLPHMLVALAGSVPNLFKSTVFWATAASVIIFVIGLQRTIKCMQYSAPLSFCSIMFMMFLIVIEYILIGQNKAQNFQNAKLFDFSVKGVLETYPLLLFAYLYQPLVPSAHRQLQRSSPRRMTLVFVGITSISVTIYMIFGVFGYLTLIHLPKELEKVNILEASPYSTRYECQFAFLFYGLVVFMACPIILKPIKDSISNRLWKGRLTSKSNVSLTMLLVALCYLFALIVPIVSDAIHVLGCTTSPFVCFIMPIMLFLKLDRSSPCSCSRIFAIIIAIFMVAFSILSLTVFIMQKTGQPL